MTGFDLPGNPEPVYTYTTAIVMITAIVTYNPHEKRGTAVFSPGRKPVAGAISWQFS
jgi:hypothetical protein